MQNSSQSLRLLFAGTPLIAAKVLERLIETQHSIIAVYTQPDRPAGRGRTLTESPVKQLALAHQLPVEQPLSLKNIEAQQQLASYQADLLIVVAYGLILPQAVLDTPAHGCINVHVSLLPRWRGAAPIQHAILAGDEKTGITIMQMDAGLDTGPILLQAEYPINPTQTSAMLHDALADLGAATLLQALDQLANHQLHPQVQSDSLATYATKITKADALLDWQQPATQLARAVRAYNPAPVAHSYLQGTLLKIWSADALPETNSAYPPGTLCHVDKTSIHVQTGQGLLALDILQLPGGKPLTTTQLLQGHHHLFSIGTSFENTP